MNPRLEKQLVVRLKVLGGILCVFALIALFYNAMPVFAETDELEREIAKELQEEEDPPPLNSFFVSSVFGIVGTGCLLISWRKKKRLFSSSPESQDPE